MMRFVQISFLLLWVVSGAVFAKPVEIVFWHSMAGQLGQELQKIIHGFNASQCQYVVKPVYKGEYLESLTSFAAAFRAHQSPAMVQVFEVGTETMLTPKGIIKPVDELMKEQGLALPVSSFFPSVHAFYSDHGRLMAMPFNISVPVLFYNTQALSKLGVDSHNFPRSWDELEALAKKVRDAGYPCAYTSAYPAWILLESYNAIHNLPMIDAKTGRAVFNTDAVIQHLHRLKRWQFLHYFEYGGRDSDASFLFTSGRCPLFSQSSGGFNSLQSMVSFPVGVAALPLDRSIRSKRYNNIAGGAAIWAVSRQPPEVYRGIAHFFAYLATPKVQSNWQQASGYLPLGLSGIYQPLLNQKETAVLKLVNMDLAASHESGSIRRFRAQNQIRLINEEALEAIFAGIKSPECAMNQAVQRANHALMRFERNTH